MSDLGQRLERFGLFQYFEVLVSEGFDTWETVLDITDSDLSEIQPLPLETPTNSIQRFTQRQAWTPEGKSYAVISSQLMLPVH